MAITTFNNLITFSRGSNATVTGPNGLIQWAPSNLLTNSQDFEAAAWVKTNATVTANAAVAPDGTTTADALTATASGTESFVLSNAALSLTNSVYVKRVNNDWFALSNSSWFAYFNISTGTAGTVQNGTASITDVGNGWWRITWSPTSGAATLRIRNVIGNGNPSVVGGEQCLIWGAQNENSPTATTYNNTSVRNLLGFSEAFDNAAWTKSASSIVTGAQANPVNGLFNAQKLMENTATNVHRVQQGFATTTGVTYTFSCYAKAAERSWIYLYDDAANGFAFFDLANGVKGTIAAGWTSTSITPVGNGWYRISGTATEASGGAGNQLIGIASANNVSNYTGDGNSGVYIYGAQLSNSASLDPYVPTPGAAPSSTAYYGPRFDYDPVTLQPRGLLIEEQRVNLLTYSEQFDNAAWEKNLVTVTANAAVAPDGTTTADLLAADGTTGVHFTRPATGQWAAGGTYTETVYVKRNTANFLHMLLEGVNAYLQFSLADGSIVFTSAGTASNFSFSVTSVGNGWYRARLTATNTGVSTFRVRYYPLNASSNTVSPNETTTASTFIWGAQVEAGAFATSYIPTIASTVTRLADVATITGSLFSQWYNQSEGGFIVEFNRSNLSSHVINVNDGTTNNRTLLYTNSLTLFSVTGGTNDVSTAIGFANAGVVNKASYAYQVNNFAGSVNGGAVSTDTSGLVPAVNRLAIGMSDSLTTQICGHIRSIRYVPVRAADFQLQQVTT